MSDEATPSIKLALPEKEAKGCKLEVQREFMPLYNIEVYSEEQQINRGQLIPTSRTGQFAGISDRDWVYFSDKYDPENNDLDKVFIKEEYDDSLTGTAFTLIPGNKIRMFYIPESSIIQLKPGGSVLV
jgi:hypothetical protein